MKNKVSKIKIENADCLFNQVINVQLEILSPHFDVCKVVINTILNQDIYRMTISELAKEVKRSSTNFINEKKWLPGKFQWQTGFGGFSY